MYDEKKQVANIYGEVQQKKAMTEIMTGRQAQEVQVAMVVAKRFPRDEVESFNRIMRACQRKSLAEQAMYEFPRGGQKITGPSINLAKAMAQNWGNIDFGTIELEQSNGVSQMMAYAWDLETNTRQTIVFDVPHVRRVKGENKVLDDPRDIYEMTANQGARRLRSCILSVIPGDVVEPAVQQCYLTMQGNNAEPLIDRIRNMAGVFEKEYSVTLEMLEKYIGCKSEAFSENDFVRLRNVYKSLRDGMGKREDYFDLPKVEQKKEEQKPEEPKQEEKQQTLDMNSL